ncbi:MAG: hypothetical protein KA383_03775 [Phycisphaerae bacterium]|nr:hypothetical protein [Phycisphaerae bacterium]
MYGIPSDADWSFLVGKELLQVCIGLHQVALRFDGEVAVNIECDFEHLRPAMDKHSQAALSTQATTLVSLLGSRIERATSEANQTLALSFTNAEVLKVHDDSASYESFQVLAPGIQIIV